MIELLQKMEFNQLPIGVKLPCFDKELQPGCVEIVKRIFPINGDNFKILFTPDEYEYAKPAVRSVEINKIEDLYFYLNNENKIVALDFYNNWAYSGYIRFPPFVIYPESGITEYYEKIIRKCISRQLLNKSRLNSRSKDITDKSVAENIGLVIQPLGMLNLSQAIKFVKYFNRIEIITINITDLTKNEEKKYFFMTDDYCLTPNIKSNFYKIEIGNVSYSNIYSDHSDGGINDFINTHFSDAFHITNFDQLARLYKGNLDGV